VFSPCDGFPDLELMLEAPKRAVKFAANDFWGKTYRQAFGIDKMTQSSVSGHARKERRGSWWTDPSFAMILRKQSTMPL
jgi:hypothetical protein